ncbi:hypothetical protein [Ruegeria sp. Ofav3-42]|uniref:hypothetical protein n=1 Tax=Ruegeria sp. Ofav3-42 TaxID=2917759 RepID=UPI001EF464D4|nr:hypothetical protein [Ruegeria sp. Ofav3-42]MCG7520994.1 hypothetical protein [Ruegeria sp. Ofav3-42]
MRRVSHMIAVLALSFGSGLAPGPALACGVCVALPEYSLADRLLSARVIVLAAPAQDNPFKYTSVSVLKGTPEQVTALPEIPFLVDSVTRSAFRADPDRTVLMIYGAGYRDKAGRSLSNGWSKGFLMTAERAQFVETLRAQGEGWASGATDRAARVDYFDDYLTHEDRMLRNAALIEIHRAPYTLVSHLTDAMPTEQLLQEMRNPNRLAYAPTYIRLLGLRSDTKAKEFVRQRYQRVVRNGGLNLYDWGLAGIEVDGALAVSGIEKALAQADRPAEEKQILIRVLAESGTAHPELQPQILDIYKRELENGSALAIWIALAVKAWNTTVLNPAFEAVLTSEAVDPATLFLIRITLEGGEPG